MSISYNHTIIYRTVRYLRYLRSNAYGSVCCIMIPYQGLLYLGSIQGIGGVLRSDAYGSVCCIMLLLSLDTKWNNCTK